MFVLPVAMYLVLPLLVLPVVLVFVFFMRSIEERSITRIGRRPPVLFNWSEDKSIVYVTTQEEYLRAGVQQVGATEIRVPDLLMVFSGLAEMEPYRSGDFNDFYALFGHDVNLSVRDLFAPVPEFFLSTGHKLRLGSAFRNFTTPKSRAACFEAAYGYREDSIYGSAVNYFVERPETWQPFTIAGTIILGTATYILGTWLSVSYIVPLVHKLIG